MRARVTELNTCKMAKIWHEKDKLSAGKFVDHGTRLGDAVFK